MKNMKEMWTSYCIWLDKSYYKIDQVVRDKEVHFPNLRYHIKLNYQIKLNVGYCLTYGCKSASTSFCYLADAETRVTRNTTHPPYQSAAFSVVYKMRLVYCEQHR
jgi:hypothetical protein